MRVPYTKHIGEKYNKLKILTFEKRGGRGYYLCKCDCGKQKWINCDSVLRRLTKTCGCLLQEVPHENLVGRKFERLTVLEYAGKIGNRRKRISWLCQCACGKKVIVSGENLKYGVTKSCGCYCLDKIKEKNTKHGSTKTRLYHIYCKMKERCYNKTCKAYKNYGGRGITVCEEWLEDFTHFEKWAKENGYSEKLSIDRINVNGNYEPTNCRWVTDKIQCNNRRSNRFIEYNGEVRTVAEWVDITGIPYGTLYSRLRKNKPMNEVFNK